MYATIDDIAAYFRDGGFTADTAVTDADVLKFIEEESNRIDLLISSRYQVPVVVGISPLSFLALQKIVEACVSFHISTILETRKNQNFSQDADGSKQILAYQPLYTQAKKDLENIRNGTYKLIDAINILNLNESSSGARADCYIPPITGVGEEW